MLQKRYSLVLRIALPSALLLFLTMGGLSLYFSNFFKNSYLDILKNNQQSETRLVADKMSTLLQSNSGTHTIDELAKRYGKILGARVTIISPDGSVLGDSSTDIVEMENHLNRPEVQKALSNTVSSETRYSDTLQTDMLYTAAPINDGSQIIGIARLAVSLNTIQQNEDRLLNSAFVAIAVAAGLSILLAIIIATYTLRPIRELTDTALKIAYGQPGEIAASYRQDEVGVLQQSIQFMARRLNEQINELRTEHSKLQGVLAHMTDGVIIVDPQGMVQMVNPAAARMFHIQEDKALHKSLVEVVRNHQLVEAWRKSSTTGEQQVAALETTPDRMFVQGIASPLETALPSMVLLLIQDLTRVRRLETVRQDFVSNVSHELRTPLASLKALAETLQEGALDDPPTARRFLQRMDTEIDNLTQMVRELFELSRIESNRVPLQRTPAAPCEIVSRAMQRMQLQGERAGLNLRIECPDDLPMVRADPERIDQVLVNLLHNAIKFTPPGGEIRISAAQEKNQVVFAIQDTGIGIASDVLPRIFERFYKVDHARSSGGTGLGLSIARHIIEAHGGKIWAVSQENVGSTFYFTLPIA